MIRRSIVQLPPDVAGKIAAGEVIERPASVVKELIENALDAGATSIQISIRAGGRDLIEVADDGAGIPAGEMALTIVRHATSKLVTVDDLRAVTTFGFRGEALASVAACSRLELTSACEDGAAATLVAEDGALVDVGRAGRAHGTTITVRGLFRHTPARLKFQKSIASEQARIHRVVSACALAHPHVRLSLVVDGRETLTCSGDGDAMGVLRALYGDDAARLVPIDVDHRLPAGASLSGFVGTPAMHRANRDQIWLFVNRRWVQSRPLSFAVEQAYRTLLMVGRHPVAVVLLTVAPDDVDVNVHPTKSEVKLAHEHAIFGGLVQCIRDTVMRLAVVPPMTVQAETFPRPLEEVAASGDHDFQPAWSPLVRQGEASVTRPGQHGSGDDGPPVLFPRTPTLRVLGQIDGTYIIAEGPQGLYLIDQHAAHERIVFDRLSDDPAEASSRPLLEPVVVELEPGQASFVAEHFPDLSRLGFALEVFGPRALLVRAVPSVLGSADPSVALREIVDELRSSGPFGMTFGEAAVWSLACKAAIKAGQPLSFEEQQELVRQLEATRSPQTCAHGRPTMVHLSVSQLERQFGRR